MSKGNYVRCTFRTIQSYYSYISGYFQSQIEKASIPIRPQNEFPNILAAPSASEIDELADRSESLEQRVASLNDSYETLKKREVELTEWRWVLREAGGFFDRVGHPISFGLLAITQADRHSRPMAMWTKFASQLTTMRRHYYTTLNSSLEVRMETPKVNSPFR